MLFRQKLAFFVFGCVFVIVGQVVTGLVVPRAQAQAGEGVAEFDVISARLIRVQMPGAESGGIAIYTDEDGAKISAFDPTGQHSFLLTASTEKASVAIAESEGLSGVEMLVGGESKSPSMRIYSAGHTLAMMGVDESGDGFVTPATAQGGGEIATFDTIRAHQLIISDFNDVERINMAAGRDIAGLFMKDPQGTTRVSITVDGSRALLGLINGAHDTSIGFSSMADRDALLAVQRGDAQVITLGSNSVGGMLAITDINGSAKAGMGVDENLNGFVIP
jgi:hypothetical protein